MIAWITDVVLHKHRGININGAHVDWPVLDVTLELGTRDELPMLVLTLALDPEVTVTCAVPDPHTES